jgi:hypothetical protein
MTYLESSGLALVTRWCLRPSERFSRLIGAKSPNHTLEISEFGQFDRRTCSMVFPWSGQDGLVIR